MSLRPTRRSKNQVNNGGGTEWTAGNFLFETLPSLANRMHLPSCGQGSSASPPRRFVLAALKKSRAPSRPGAGPSALHHLFAPCGAPPQPWPSDSHLAALGGHKLAPRLPQVLAACTPRRQSAFTLGRAAQRLPLQHPLYFCACGSARRRPRLQLDVAVSQERLDTRAQCVYPSYIFFGRSMNHSAKEGPRPGLLHGAARRTLRKRLPLSSALTTCQRRKFQVSGEKHC